MDFVEALTIAHPWLARITCGRPGGFTAMLETCISYHPQPDIVGFLINNGAPVDYCSPRRDDIGPLHATLMYLPDSEDASKSHEKVARLLLQGSPSLISSQYKVGGNWASPLHHVLIQDSPNALSFAQMLIDFGADVNVADSLGMRPLHYSADKSPQLLKLLLDNGAAVDDVLQRSTARL